jgi:hypothetical protein
MREGVSFAERFPITVAAFEYEACLEFDGLRFRVYRRRRKAGHPWRIEHERVFDPAEEFTARRYYASLRQELASEVGAS